VNKQNLCEMNQVKIVIGCSFIEQYIKKNRRVRNEINVRFQQCSSDYGVRQT